MRRDSRSGSRASRESAMTRRQARPRRSRNCVRSTSGSSRPRAGQCRLDTLMTTRVSTGLAKLDAMLGGGLLPGTLAVVYGATGIGKTHLGLTFAAQGVADDGARGVVLDMNGRGDSQQHDEYAARLFHWALTPWTHTVTPMAPPYPPAGQMDAFYSNALRWVGRVRDFQVPASDGGSEFDWNWKAAYNQALYTVRPFLYFHFGAGSRRVVVDGVEPMDSPADSIQFHMFNDVYRTI